MTNKRPPILNLEIGRQYKTRSGKRVSIFGSGKDNKGLIKYFGRYDSGKELKYNIFGRSLDHMGYDILSEWSE